MTAALSQLVRQAYIAFALMLPLTMVSFQTRVCKPEFEISSQFLVETYHV